MIRALFLVQGADVSNMGGAVEAFVLDVTTVKVFSLAQLAPSTSTVLPALSVTLLVCEVARRPPKMINEMTNL